MSVRFDIKGLDDLKAALRALPAELTGEASKIIEGAGNGAVLDIRRAYPGGGTGNLRAGVSVEFDRSGVHAGAVVRSRSPHAWWYDYGTEVRHTAKGWKRGRMFGRSAPTHAFGQAMAKVRRRMYEDLGTMLERHGLKVTRG